MSEFVSVLDIMENAPYGAQTAVRDEVAAMDADLRSAMYGSLTTEDRMTAQASGSGVHAAAAILDKIFA